MVWRTVAVRCFTHQRWATQGEKLQTADSEPSRDKCDSVGAWQKPQLFELCCHHCHVALVQPYAVTQPNCVLPFLESVSEVDVGSRKIKSALHNLSTLLWRTQCFRNSSQNLPPVVLYKNINRSQLPAVLFRVEDLSNLGTVQIVNIFPALNFAKNFHLFQLWSCHKAIDSSCSLKFNHTSVFR